MLPAAHRLRRPADFTSTVRRGARRGRRTVVVHLRHDQSPASGVGSEPPRIGFIVSRAVGNSVVRHRVTRRLRHLIAARLHDLPDGCTVVVRALPAAATAESVALGADLDAALGHLSAGWTADRS